MELASWSRRAWGGPTDHQTRLGDNSAFALDGAIDLLEQGEAELVLLPHEDHQHRREDEQNGTHGETQVDDPLLGVVFSRPEDEIWKGPDEEKNAPEHVQPTGPPDFPPPCATSLAKDPIVDELTDGGQDEEDAANSVHEADEPECLPAWPVRHERDEGPNAEEDGADKICDSSHHGFHGHLVVLAQDRPVGANEPDSLCPRLQIDELQVRGITS
mmetsp:Transcript_88907/g.194824  ORF Transcript_88907/g.194824 Transcript_88907/m.194824 type:complete len:215 (-) Transcript_88907:99-743(-)